MSPVGIFQTCKSWLTTSALRGVADIAQSPFDAFGPEQTCHCSLNPHGTTAHTIPIGGRPRCGSSRHKHHTVVAMAGSYGGGNDNARQCRVEPDGIGEGGRGCSWDGRCPGGNDADRGERPYGEKDTACLHGGHGGGVEARTAHCQGERQAAAQEALTIPANSTNFPTNSRPADARALWNHHEIPVLLGGVGLKRRNTVVGGLKVDEFLLWMWFDLPASELMQIVRL